jgi:transcriptional regulator
MIPSPAQAKVYWLNAIGVSVKEIAAMLSVSRENAQATLDAARKKAKKVGLSYQIELKPKAELPTIESGMSIAMTLAREAKLIK